MSIPKGYKFGYRKRPPPMPIEQRKKISARLKGRRPYEMTDEIRNRIAIAQRRIGKKPPSRLGWHQSEASKRKIAEHSPRYWLGKKRMDFSGEHHPRWKGGYENTLMANRRRRILRAGNGGCHTLREWMQLKAMNAYLCALCGEAEFNAKLTEDHIIPIVRGGSNNIENIQPVCRICNSKKHAKLDADITYYFKIVTLALKQELATIEKIAA